MANGWTDEQLAYLVRFRHLEKLLAGMPGLNDESIGTMFGITGEAYRAIRDEQDAAARDAATELAFAPGMEQTVGKLPIPEDATVVCLGDSITDDSSSWCEILRHLLAALRPDVTVVNAGVSGDTTSQMISRFGAVVAAQPAWIVCLAGTNDCRLHGLKPAKTLVSLAETEANLAMLANYAETQVEGVRWLRLTPPPVIEEAIGKHWFLGPMQMMWRNDDLRQVGDLLRLSFAPVVDLSTVFSAEATPQLLLDDGLHPSLAGQRAIAAAVVEAWAALS